MAKATTSRKKAVRKTTNSPDKNLQGMDSGSDNMTDKTGKDSALHTFFLKALNGIYWSETQLIDALEKMEKAASAPELRDLFEDHRLQTQKHVSRLEKVFKGIEEQPTPRQCAALAELIKEADQIIQEIPAGATRDAALIIAAQKVEHYEIAIYGGLLALSRTMDLDDVADILESTLDEEEQTDLNLTDVAESYINFQSVEEAVV